MNVKMKGTPSYGTTSFGEHADDVNENKEGINKVPYPKNRMDPGKGPISVAWGLAAHLRDDRP